MNLRPTHVSKMGTRFVGAWEGFISRPYNDVAGNATIGYGHKLHDGPVTEADRHHWGTITHDQALGLLGEDLHHAGECVRDKVHPPILLQWRFDALASFVFNLGCGYLQGDHTIARALNSGRLRSGAADAFLLYDHAGGKVVQGLKARREAERRLFLYGYYGKVYGG